MESRASLEWCAFASFQQARLATSGTDSVFIQNVQICSLAWEILKSSRKAKVLLYLLRRDFMVLTSFWVFVVTWSLRTAAG